MPGDATASGNVLTNDSDADASDVLTVTNAGTIAGTYGSLTLNADGSCTYTLDNADADTEALETDDVVQEVFTYGISDGKGDRASAALRITIAGSMDNTVPEVTADSLTLDEDTPTVLKLMANETDANGDAITINGVGTVAYAPDADANGTENFSYTAADGKAESVLADLDLTVNAVNDAPTLTLVGTPPALMGGPTVLPITLSNVNDGDETSTAPLGNGTFVAAWSSARADGSVRIFNYDGTPLTGDI